MLQYRMVFMVLALIAACSSTPPPPIYLGDPAVPSVLESSGINGGIPIAVLPVELAGSENDRKVGVLFHTTGGISDLLLHRSVADSLSKSLKAVLKANGYRPYDATTTRHSLSVKMTVHSFYDKVTANVLHVKEEAVLKCDYTLTKRSGDRMEKLVKTSDRFNSPTASVMFDKNAPPQTMGLLLNDSLQKDLVPTLKTFGNEDSR